MSNYIKDASFRELLRDVELQLPMRWSGGDFHAALQSLFGYYQDKLRYYSEKSKTDVPINLESIQKVCDTLIEAVQFYLQGRPSMAYITFEEVMKILMNKPLEIEVPRFIEDVKTKEYALFRAVRVSDNISYPRTRAFHVPYSIRGKACGTRYSIAGNPSLYLGTSLALCCEEIGRNPYQSFTIVSGFRLSDIKGKYTLGILDLGIKPQDFSSKDRVRSSDTREVDRNQLMPPAQKTAYLLWYPLIAACSFIRTNRSDPFAPEYIMPQLMMQWVRNQMEDNKLYGIRYFSCASVRASDMGFNFVFPTSGTPKSNRSPYCKVLSQLFDMTEPIFLHEFDSIEECETEMKEKGIYQKPLSTQKSI